MALWDKIGSTGSVEDRRGMSTGGIAVSGVTGLILFLAMMFLGGQDNTMLDQVLNQAVQQGSTQTTDQPTQFDGADDYEVFTSKVLGSNNDVWSGIFAAQGQQYTPPKLVLFRQATQSGCGYASSAVGPHYCPNDQTVYLDETFFDELQKRFGGSSGDVAQAYVISHEVGHHVQNLKGDMDQMMQAQQNGSGDANQLSVALELQADCYAGVWANSLRDLGVFESDKEINEALSAASAVGDDHIQETMSGSVNPESWTHGSSDQRVSAFKTGFTTGDASKCSM
jgi:predicted metalloprotease